jgi:amino acid transporter
MSCNKTARQPCPISVAPDVSSRAVGVIDDAFHDHPAFQAQDLLSLPGKGISIMPELRTNSLSFLEVLGQSIANISPTFTPALAVAVVAGMAGTGSWLVYVLATMAMVIVGINVGKLAARIPSAGSFFIYVSRSLGSGYGMLTGWSMLAAYIFTAATATIAMSIFLNSLLQTLGLPFAIPPIVLYTSVSLLIWYLAVRDIRISSRIGLVMEGISVLAILLVCLVAWSRTGFKVDQKQLHL